jgi:hypothetical protein
MTSGPNTPRPARLAQALGRAALGPGRAPAQAVRAARFPAVQPARPLIGLSGHGLAMLGAPAALLAPAAITLGATLFFWRRVRI